MSFVKRQIDVSFVLGEGTFGESGNNQLKLTGHRIAAKILKAGGAAMGTAQVTIYGMTLSEMNRLSTLGMTPTLVRKNSITVEAGDEGGSKSTVFQGTITSGLEDLSGAPEVCFHVIAASGLFEAVKPADPSTYAGGVKVATIMQDLAGKMGLTFENNGVDQVVSRTYLFGSARNQAQAVAKAAGIEWVIDDGKLAIWPRGKARTGAQTPTVSPATGMIGYPTYTSVGIMVRQIFNGQMTFGGKIKVESQLQAASGEWNIYGLDHDLEAEMPGGRWETQMACSRLDLALVR